MISFSDFLIEAYKDDRRCTAITCNAIAKHHGLEPIVKQGEKAPMSGASVLERFKNHGLSVTGHHDQGYAGKTVKQFVKDHPTGAHYIGVRGHAMALTDGKLHDSSGRGADRRRIEFHYKINKE